jgi:hypothetical protein
MLHTLCVVRARVCDLRSNVSLRYLDNELHKSLSAGGRAVDLGIHPGNASSKVNLPIREASHVQFNFVLLYSACVIDAGRTLSGVTY